MSDGRTYNQAGVVLFLLAICALLSLAACGRRYGELTRYDLTKPGATSLQLDAAQAFLVGENRMNTFQLYRDGKECGETTRTLVRIPTLPDTWRTYDGQQNWIEFLLKKEGLFITRAHNEEYKSWIQFPGPFEMSPATMEQEDRFTRQTPFYTWADTWTTRTGSMTMQVKFAGEESIDTPLGRMDRCVRVDSHFDVSLSFGLPFTASIDQRQWIHPEYGEVLRDLDGTYGIVGIPVSSFTSRQLINASRALTDKEKAPLAQENVPRATKTPPARKLTGRHR